MEYISQSVTQDKTFPMIMPWEQLNVYTTLFLLVMKLFLTIVAWNATKEIMVIIS